MTKKKPQPLEQDQPDKKDGNRVRQGDCIWENCVKAGGWHGCSLVGSRSNWKDAGLCALVATMVLAGFKPFPMELREPLECLEQASCSVRAGRVEKAPRWRE